MPLKYGDSVTLVQKLPGGKTIRRVNAIVLSSAIQPPNASRPAALRTALGAVLPEGEYCHLAYADPDFPESQVSSRPLEHIFRHAHLVAAWKDGANIGWELPGWQGGLPSAADLDSIAADQKAKEATTEKGKSSWGKKNGK